MVSAKYNISVLKEIGKDFKFLIDVVLKLY